LLPQQIILYLYPQVSEWKTVADCAARERLEAVRAADALSVEVAELRASLAASESTCSELRESARAKFALEAQIAELHNSLKVTDATRIVVLLRKLVHLFFILLLTNAIFCVSSIFVFKSLILCLLTG